MNTTLNQTGGNCCRKLLTGLAAAGLLFSLTACRTTHQVRGSMEN
jgi:hypothetical protein